MILSGVEQRERERESCQSTKRELLDPLEGPPILPQGRSGDRYAGVGSVDEIIRKYLFAKDSRADFRGGGKDRRHVKWTAGDISRTARKSRAIWPRDIFSEGEECVPRAARNTQ